MVTDDLLGYMVRSCQITADNLDRHGRRFLSAAESCDVVRQRWSRPLAELQQDLEDIAEVYAVAVQYIRRKDDAERAAESVADDNGRVPSLPGASSEAEESRSGFRQLRESVERQAS